MRKMRNWGRPRRWTAVALVVGLVAAAGATTAAVAVRDEPAAEALDHDNPILEVPPPPAPSSTSTSGSTTTTLAPLPTPEPPPADPYADVPIVELGAIQIPKIGLDHAIYEGITLTVINEGPGHWPGTAMPGERGNTVFPGHRTTYSRPFHDLDKLVPGDEVIFTTAAGTFVYHVRETLIVAPTDLWIVDQNEGSSVTLFACHPKGSARQRIVVQGDLVASYPNEAPGQAGHAGEVGQAA